MCVFARVCVRTCVRVYTKFHWLISHVQLSSQPQSVNILGRLTHSQGDTAVFVRI